MFPFDRSFHRCLRRRRRERGWWFSLNGSVIHCHRLQVPTAVPTYPCFLRNSSGTVRAFQFLSGLGDERGAVTET